jgi:anionic cell wall polymer biosynthesis LytR-Cps2A-Psr (LCP) family protein
MQKQRLVQLALLEQINPLQLALNFQSVAQAGSNYVSTNIPRDQLPSFIELALKAQKESVKTLELVPPTIDVTNPDIAWIQSEVSRLTSQ